MSPKGLGDLLVEYVRRRGPYMSEDEYQNMLLMDIYNQLRQFVKYMEDKDTIMAYTVSCDDQGWKHRNDGNRIMKTEGNRPICRLMVGALYFMNKNRWERDNNAAQDTGDERLKDYVRCGIVHMFEELLLEASCGANWGIEYAWDIMKEIEQSMHGLITDNICNMQRAENIKIGEWSMKAKIKKWLEENEEFKAKLQVKKVGNKCTGHGKSTSKDERASTAISEGQAKKIKREKNAEKILWAKVKTVVREARKEVRDKIKDLDKNIPRHAEGNVTRGGDFIDISDSEDENADDDDDEEDDEQDQDDEEDAEEQDAKEKETSNQNGDHSHHKKEDKKDATSNEDRKIQQTPPPTTGAVAGATELGRADTTAGGGEASQPQAPASPVLPSVPQAPPSTPSSPTAGDKASTAQSPGQGPGPGQQPPPPPPPQGNAPEGTQGGQDADKAVDADCGTNPEDPQEGKDSITPPEGTTQIVHKETDPVSAQLPTEPNHVPISTKPIENNPPDTVITNNEENPTKSKVDDVPEVINSAPEPVSAVDGGIKEPEHSPGAQDTPGPVGANGHNGEAEGTRERAATPILEDTYPDHEFWDIVSSVNPPADDTAGTGPGFSGSTPKARCDADTVLGGAREDKGFGLDLSGPKGLDSIARGFAPATPTQETSGNWDINKNGGPDGPDLTDTVLTATTPVLFFLSAVTVALLGYSLWKASTLGTSSATVTSQFDTVDATRVGSTTVTLSDGTDVGKQGTRNVYDGQATGSPGKNRVFVDMRRKLKSKVHVKNPVPVKKKPQGGTAQNKLKECCQKLKRCKMGRKAWTILIVISTVLYAFFMTMIQPFSNETETGIMLVLSALGSMHGIALLIAIIYLCVLLCFCCSKTGKCLLDKIWKKKEKKEAPTETQKKGEVNKKPETPGKQKVPGKPEVPNKQKPEVPEKHEAPGTAGESEKLEAPKKPEVPKKSETPRKPELAETQEASGKSDIPAEPEVGEKQGAPGKLQLPWILTLPGQSDVCSKPEVPKKPEVLVKPETRMKSEVPKKPEVANSKKHMGN
ncbi:hypothetical protein AK88_01863 [Plasmodium fragile]|uniref:Uncharacterized protein n=1 Tax=Plasmodium fragile TaxID=5857 RepID=A0A0D9QRV7_PLAFR|nr:uncharacterized protein AK88_01863 [Plasmodium fragile]KJP88411.1 hypothetical protein AK88_01863 [Plasmodium fragile]